MKHFYCLLLTGILASSAAQAGEADCAEAQAILASHHHVPIRFTVPANIKIEASEKSTYLGDQSCQIFVRDKLTQPQLIKPHTFTAYVVGVEPSCSNDYYNTLVCQGEHVVLAVSDPLISHIECDVNGSSKYGSKWDAIQSVTLGTLKTALTGSADGQSWSTLPSDIGTAKVCTTGEVADRSLMTGFTAAHDGIATLSPASLGGESDSAATLKSVPQSGDSSATPSKSKSTQSVAI